MKALMMDVLPTLALPMKMIFAFLTSLLMLGIGTEIGLLCTLLFYLIYFSFGFTVESPPVTQHPFLSASTIKLLLYNWIILKLFFELN